MEKFKIKYRVSEVYEGVLEGESEEEVREKFLKKETFNKVKVIPDSYLEKIIEIKEGDIQEDDIIKEE